ncbi:YbaY family lipoprotein [Ferrovibrio sp.]|uniref:YbaY family lipoprotein n=1 Tax=Ferrovibrio sp. TaxID=1917215 RepID=UPI003510DD93
MILRRSFLTAAAALAVSSFAACASRASSVDGTVSYRERLILPADSRVVVRLEDITRGQAYPVVVAEQYILPQSAAVTRFSLPYSLNDIDPGATYVVTAWIEQGGRVLFRNAQLHQVLTKTAPKTGIHVELEQVTAMFVPAPTGTVVQPAAGTVIVQPSPQAGTMVIAPAPAQAPAGSVILQPAR